MIGWVKKGLNYLKNYTITFYVTRHNCNGYICPARTTKNSINTKKLGMTATYTSTPRSPKHCSYTNQKIEKYILKSESGIFIK